MASTVSPTTANNPAWNEGAGWGFDGLDMDPNFPSDFDPAPAPDFFLNSVEVTQTHTQSDDAQDAEEDLPLGRWPGNANDQIPPQVEEYETSNLGGQGFAAQSVGAAFTSASETSPAESTCTDGSLFGGDEPTLNIPPQVDQHEGSGQRTYGATACNKGKAYSASSQAPPAQDAGVSAPEVPLSYAADLNDNTWGFTAAPETAALQGGLISAWSPPGLQESLLNQPLDFEQSLAQQGGQMLPAFPPNNSQPQYGNDFIGVPAGPMNQWQGAGASGAVVDNTARGMPEVNWDLLNHDLLKEAGIDPRPPKPAVPKIDTRKATRWAQMHPPMQAGMSAGMSRPTTGWASGPASTQARMAAGPAPRLMTPTSATSWGPVPAQMKAERPAGPASMRAGPAFQRTTPTSAKAWAPIPGQMQPKMEAVPPMMQAGPALRRAAPISTTSSRPMRMPPRMGQQYPMPGPAYPVPAPGTVPHAYINYPPAAKPEEEDYKRSMRLVHHRGKAMISPKQVYQPLAEAPRSWGPPLLPDLFSYTEHGEWEPSLRLSTTDTRWYITNAARVGSRPLKIWIQHLPAQRNYRYPHTLSSKCRWDECPAAKGTILKGFYRVAFDERPDLSGRATDPFHNAGYMHLHCFEKMFDVYELIQCGLAALDNRVFPREDRNPMAVVSDHPHMAKAYKDWCYAQDAAYRQFQERRSRGEARHRFIPQELKLWHVLTKGYVDMESAARMKMRDERQGNSLDKHGGDLDRYVADTEKRKALNKVARKRVADEFDDEGGSALGEDGPRVKRARCEQAPEPPSPALSHITVTSSLADSPAGGGEGWVNDAKSPAGEGEAPADGAKSPAERNGSANVAKSPSASPRRRSSRNTLRTKNGGLRNEAVGLKRPWDAGLREGRRLSVTTQARRRSTRRVSA